MVVLMVFQCQGVFIASVGRSSMAWFSRPQVVVFGGCVRWKRGQGVQADPCKAKVQPRKELGVKRSPAVVNSALVLECLVRPSLLNVCCMLQRSQHGRVAVLPVGEIVRWQQNQLVGLELQLQTAVYRC